MSSNQLNYKINKYTQKLQACGDLEHGEVYQRKLQKYHRLQRTNQMGGRELTKQELAQVQQGRTGQQLGSVREQAAQMERQLGQQQPVLPLQQMPPPQLPVKGLPPATGQKQVMQPVQQQLPQQLPQQKIQTGLPAAVPAPAAPKPTPKPAPKPVEPKPLYQHTPLGEAKNLDQLNKNLTNLKTELDQHLSDISFSAGVDTKDLEDSLNTLKSNIDQLAKTSKFNKDAAQIFRKHTDGLTKSIEDTVNRLSDSPTSEGLGDLVKSVSDMNTEFKTMIDQFDIEDYTKYNRLEILLGQISDDIKDNNFNKINKTIDEVVSVGPNLKPESKKELQSEIKKALGVLSKLQGETQQKVNTQKLANLKL